MADSVVPFSHGERLYAAAPEPKRFQRCDGGGHGWPRKEDFIPQVQAFLAQTAR